MKISLNWIKEFVDIPATSTATRLAELLTLRTCEVEGFEDEAAKFSGMVVGKVRAIRPHPNADKLRLADTDIGGALGRDTVQIVCGGKNLEEEMLVPVALPGAVINWHGAGEIMELKETKIRGEESFGMICAGEEIGLPPSPPEGITDLEHLWTQWGLPAAKPGTSLARALKLDDVIFEIDNKSITHRPDLWGHYGMAREFAAFLFDKLELRSVANRGDALAPSQSSRARAVRSQNKLKPFVVHVSNPPSKGTKVAIKLEKPGIATRFLSAIITGIHVEPSPSWMQNRLRAVGMKPVNNIVDITNYVMLELGHPLHAFDRRIVENDTFEIRFAREGEILETLDHKKRPLHKEDVLVTNGKRPLALAGIMGGLDSEINAKTTEIILEVARWDPLLVRKTSARHGLKSDAAQRFEKSLDPEYTGFAFHRACELIFQLCTGAAFAGPVTDLYPEKNKVRKLSTVTVDTKTIRGKIGAEITDAEMIRHLKSLEFGAKKTAGGKLRVEVPTFRATKDISIEDDIVEEVARMHGYEKIPASLPHLPIRIPRENRERSIKHRARQILSLGLGFSEVNLYSFYGAAEMRNAILPPEAHLEIKNPLTADQSHLRISLLPNMLKAAALNEYHRKNFKLYEAGRTYIKDSSFPREEKFICGIVAGSAGEQGEIFYEALAALRNFFHQFHLEMESIELASPPPYAHPSKGATVKIQGKEIAAIYEIHPQVLANFGIKSRVSAFEINFTRFAALNLPIAHYTPLPRFPGIELDVSVLVSKGTQTRTVGRLIRNAAPELIATVSLLDIFEDKSLGEDKKSFTFRALLQSSDRTLTDDEMKEAQQKIWGALRGSGFEIR